MRLRAGDASLGPHGAPENPVRCIATGRKPLEDDVS